MNTRLFLFGMLWIFPRIVHAQNTSLIVTPGTNMIIAGGNMVLNNTDCRADGILDAAAATILVTGSNNSSFMGAGIPVIGTMTLNTSTTTILTLQDTLRITVALNFQNGLIDLNNRQIQLQGNAVLQNESETSRITGLAGGSVTASAASVSSPSQLNIGNLGAELTTTANLGNISISRMAKPATNPGNSSLSGIQRTYLIQPQNDVSLNATLRFHYLAAELNGRNESTLSLWKSSDGINWSLIGADSRNTTTHYVEKTGIPDLSYWTLTDVINPLPIILLSFKAICEDNYALLQWATGVESGTDYFEVQRSMPGGDWKAIARISALDDPNGASYSYKDQDPQAAAFYRLKIVDRSGMLNYSPVFSGGCADIAFPFGVYPNPAKTQAVARVSVRESITGDIGLYNMEGRQLYRSAWILQPGVNQFVLPVSQLAAGVYLVKARLGNSVFQAQLIKQ